MLYHIVDLFVSCFFFLGILQSLLSRRADYEDKIVFEKGFVVASCLFDALLVLQLQFFQQKGCYGGSK